MANPVNLFQYYQQKGQKLPSWQERQPVYEQFGLGNAGEYIGSTEQNNALLQALNKGISQNPINSTGQVQVHVNPVASDVPVNPIVSNRNYSNIPDFSSKADYGSQLTNIFQNQQDMFNAYMKNIGGQQSSLDLYKQMAQELGLPQKQEALSGISTQVQKTEDLLNNLENDINARISGKLISEPQRRRSLAVEQSPLREQLTGLLKGQGYAEQGVSSTRQQLSDMLNMAQSDQANKLALAKAPLEYQQSMLPSYLKTLESQQPAVQEPISPKYQEVQGGLYDTTNLKWIVPPKTTATTAEVNKELITNAFAKAKPVLEASVGKDGYIDPGVYMKIRNDYAEAIGSVSNFDAVFAPRLSPQERERLGIGKESYNNDRIINPF
jgi:hypothetical protein